MAARITTVLHLAGWILAAILTHAALVSHDTFSPLSVHDTVVALEWDAEASHQLLNEDLDDFARDTGIVFGKLVPGQDSDATTTTVFLYGDGETVTSGIPGAPVDGYSTANQISYRPAVELGLQAPIGSYYVYGTDADARNLAGFLSDHGFTVQGITDHDDPAVLIGSVSPDIMAAAQLAVLVIAVTAGGSVLLARRAHGIAFLQGLSWRRQWPAHARHASLRWAAAGLLILPGAAGWLAFYNGGQGWALYLGATAAASTVLLAVDLAATAATLMLLARLPLPRALAGAMPVRTVAAASYAVILLSALAFLTSGATAVQLRSDLQSRSDALDPYDDAAEMVNVATTTLNRDTADEDDLKVAEWLAEVDRAGDLILADKTSLMTHDLSLQDQTVLHVNDRYLEAQPIELADGTVFSPSAEDATVLIPSSLWDKRDRIMAGLDWDFLLGDGQASQYDPEPVEIRDSSHFTYSTTETEIASTEDPVVDASYVTDPVVVSLPSTTSPMNPSLWMNPTSNGEVVFPDPAVVEQALADRPELNRAILYTAPIAGEARSERLEVLRDLQIAVLSAALSAATLLASVFLATYLYSRATAQWILAHHLHGRRFLRTHRWFLLGAAALTAAVAAWIPVNVWRSNSEYRAAVEAGAAPRTARAVIGLDDLSAIGSVVLVLAATVLVATALAHRRIVRHGSAEA